MPGGSDNSYRASERVRVPRHKVADTKNEGDLYKSKCAKGRAASGMEGVSNCRQSRMVNGPDGEECKVEVELSTEPSMFLGVLRMKTQNTFEKIIYPTLATSSFRTKSIIEVVQQSVLQC